MATRLLACWAALGLQLAGLAAARCPLALVEVQAGEGGEDVLVERAEGLEYLERLPSPIYFVSVAGVFRGGKSMLLNRCRRLQAPYDEGFGVGHAKRTFTRGIQICAEQVEGLGSVVWLDSEGLWSSEETRGRYGAKIFSLTLLFSSTLLLNNRGSLSEQFFEYFGQQQTLARTLKKGLEDEHLDDPELLLPPNLTVFWILSQPTSYDASAGETRRMLEEYLGKPGDDVRARVKSDFRHLAFEVPHATPNQGEWGALDTLPDQDLSPEYVAATADLRERILEVLHTNARPMTSASATAALKMYIKLVTTGTFDADLAKDAFQAKRAGELCEAFAEGVLERAGKLPMTARALQEAVRKSRAAVAPQLEEFRQGYYVGEAWTSRVNGCFNQRVQELQARNQEEVYELWRSQAQKVSDQGGFYLHTLLVMRSEFKAEYGEAFDAEGARRQSEEWQKKDLRNVATVGCLLRPFVPLALGPILSTQLKNGLFADMNSMLWLGLKAVAAYGLHHAWRQLPFVPQLPAYLNLDYKVFADWPWGLERVLGLPPIWPAAAWLTYWAGTIVSVLLVMRRARAIWRQPAGVTEEVVLVERKVNALLTRSERGFEDLVVAAALDAADLLEQSQPRRAARRLQAGLVSVLGVDEGDWVLAAKIERPMRQRIRGTLKRVHLPPLAPQLATPAAAPAPPAHQLDRLAAGRDIEALAEEMERVFVSICRAQEALAHRPLAAGGVAGGGAGKPGKQAPVPGSSPGSGAGRARDPAPGSPAVAQGGAAEATVPGALAGEKAKALGDPHEDSPRLAAAGSAASTSECESEPEPSRVAEVKPAAGGEGAEGCEEGEEEEDSGDEQEPSSSSCWRRLCPCARAGSAAEAEAGSDAEEPPEVPEAEASEAAAGSELESGSEGEGQSPASGKLGDLDLEEAEEYLWCCCFTGPVFLLLFTIVCGCSVALLATSVLNEALAPAA